MVSQFSTGLGAGRSLSEYVKLQDRLIQVAGWSLHEGALTCSFKTDADFYRKTQEQERPKLWHKAQTEHYLNVFKLNTKGTRHLFGDESVTLEFFCG
jgi:hypothetical protein